MGISFDSAEKWARFTCSSQYDIELGTKKFEDLKRYLSESITTPNIPGAVLLIAQQGSIKFHQAFGKRRLEPYLEEMTLDTVFDLASLTKVVATWPTIMSLLDRGLINLYKPIQCYLDIPSKCQASQITIAHLLTHTSGLPESTFVRQYGTEKEEIIQGICREPLQNEIGKKVVYSNRGFILLGEIIERVSGSGLNQYVDKYIWHPLGIRDTYFNPKPDLLPRIAPTEYRSEIGSCQHGEVHDENAAWLGGVAGHAGVFSTSCDLAAFSAMILSGGKCNGHRILSEEAITRSFCNHTRNLNEARGYAWTLQEAMNGQRVTFQVYAHLGFTGTAIWLIPALDMFVILLTNRVHPSRNNQSGIKQLREQVLYKCLSW